MASVGNITVPTIPVNGTFPLATDYGYSVTVQPNVGVHTFGSANNKLEQRFYVGTGERRFFVKLARMTRDNRQALESFWGNRMGPYEWFYFDAPNESGSGTTRYTCRFANEPLNFDYLANEICTAGVTLIGHPTTLPPYSISSTDDRFPSYALQQALLSDIQECFPLIVVTPRETGYPPAYLSDRDCIVSAVPYVARLLNWSGISQSIEGSSDLARFTFGNADRVMQDFAADTDLWRAHISFSIYHVGTGVRLNLWSGEIIDWSGEGTHEFHVQAADGIYNLGLQYPVRLIDARCYKNFKDNGDCPYTGGATTCNRSWDQCVSYGMSSYFGGIMAEPQGVYIRNNAARGRPHFTATSIVSDSMYGQVVQEVYTDVDMRVPAQIVSVREQEGFFAGLGIVSAGPIAEFHPDTAKHMLDDGSAHGPIDQGYGYRRAYGGDPATGSDAAADNQPDGDSSWFSLSPNFNDYKAAGTAFMEITRIDEKGIQPSRVEQHEMYVWVRKGMGGWIWTASGSRNWESCLVNPVWVAVNVYLRGLGIGRAPIATQEAVLDLETIIDAAGHCDTIVDKIVDADGGTATVDGDDLVWASGDDFKPAHAGQYINGVRVYAYQGKKRITMDSSPIAGSWTVREKQFTFRGIIKERKALRDWLTEILNNCLGYYYFRNGKLAIQLRIDASLDDAQSFTDSSILLDSLQLSSVKPRFNTLAGTIGCHAFEGWQGITVSVSDTDHTAKYGPSPVQLNLVGTSVKSQASRIVATRLREELGGTTGSERRYARRGTFKTTILALNVAPGMLCALTHFNITGTTVKFRVQNWTLNPDWSVDIEWQTVTDSMYDYTSGDLPVELVIPEGTIELQPLPRGMIWHPHLEEANVADPMFAGEFSYNLQQDYSTLADATQRAVLHITGTLPMNKTIAGVNAPSIRNGWSNTVGGSMTGQKFVYIAVAGKDSNDRYTPLSNILQIATSGGTNSNTAVIGGITWPAMTYEGYVIFAAYDTNTMVCMQYEADTASPPTAFELTDISYRSSWGPPLYKLRRLRAKAKEIAHSGPIGVAIEDVGMGTITVTALIDPADDWSKRIVSVIADESDGSAHMWNFSVISYDNGTGIFTISPDPQAAGVQAGDALIVRTACTEAYSGCLTATSSTFTDPRYENKLSERGDPPVHGLEPDVEIGRLARVIAGTGRGQVRKIIDNDYTTCTVTPDWTITPDYTSSIIIEEPTWEYIVDSNDISNDEIAKSVMLTLPVGNMINKTLLTQVVTVDKDGIESGEEYSPIREIWLYGSQVPNWKARFIDGADPLVTGTDLMVNHYCVDIPDDRQINLYDGIMTLKSAPTGTVNIDILRSENGGSNWASLWNTTPSSGDKTSTHNDFAITVLHAADLLRYDCLATGNGGGLEFVLRGFLADFEA